MERIKSCRVCKGRQITEFLDLGKQPYANSLLESPDEKENFYPLSLSWCPDCSLVQLNHTAEPADLFTDYVWVTATSRTAREYARVLYREILSRTGSLDNGYVLEVASNDGTFLRPFAENHQRVLGIDPARNIVDIAVDTGIPTLCKFFGVGASEEIVSEFGRAKVIIARNVLPHVANTLDFVEGLYNALAEDGLLVIEFHYGKTIFEELQYDSIYHEHLCYFTLKSIENLLNRFGLFIDDITESPISGGSLVLYVKKSRNMGSQTAQSYRDAEEESGVNELSRWEDFARRVRSHRKLLLEILTGVTRKTGRAVGYGSSARSSTLLNFCGIDTRFISVIADQSPLKQRRYTAGTHIPIASPEEVMKGRPKCILISAWNFADEIMKILKDRYHFNGQCILPLPYSPRIESLG